MSVVLGAVAKRDAEKISKRPAAASGGKTKKAKTSGTSGEEATFSCEWSREQFMGRTGAASKGTTKRFPFAECGGMGKAMKACKDRVADINSKRKA